MLESDCSRSDIEKLWDHWYPLVYGYFYRRVNNREDVEDLTANTMTAFLTKADVVNPKGFVWQTAKNQLYKYISQKSDKPSIVELHDNHEEQERFISFEEFEEEIEDKYSDHYQAKINQLVECCKKQLSDDDYKIVYMSIVDDCNSTQIGEEFSIKPATVRQKIKRSFDKLKQHCTDMWVVLKEA